MVSPPDVDLRFKLTESAPALLELSRLKGKDVEHLHHKFQKHHSV
jgi:hypothetical protein